MSIFKFNLGDEIKDVISGLKGIVISRTEWFNGCIRYVIGSQKLTNGKPGDDVAMDEAQMVLVKANKVPAPFSTPAEAPAATETPTPKVRTGGPRNDMRSPAKDSMSRSRR